ncbi:hypothetical protein, partial [Rhodopseudomonas sp.]|uniref:hypothetical protein n=1 Tax=Rhodopseudomonas sp. TaxID=1078 RepID=UPI003B3A56BF
MRLAYQAACAAVKQAVPPERGGTAEVSIDPQPYAAGDPLGLDREFRPADSDLWLGFIDLEPHKNWGHQALAVLVRDGGTEIRPALFPPAL